MKISFQFRKFPETKPKTLAELELERERQQRMAEAWIAAHPEAGAVIVTDEMKAAEKEKVKKYLEQGRAKDFIRDRIL
jgi:mannose-6-phosphate isomerase class I